MAIKKLNKKAELKLTGIVVSLLLVIGIFTGMFLLMQQQADHYNVPIDSKYNDTYSRLSTSQSSISSNVNEIKDNVKTIAEADSVYQVAWNGLKGIGNTLKLPLSFLDDSISVFEALDTSLDVVPKWVKTLSLIGIIAVIVLLVLAILKGEQKM